jgi:hypothetical protein
MNKYERDVPPYTFALILHYGAAANWFICAAQLFTTKLKLHSCSVYVQVYQYFS